MTVDQLRALHHWAGTPTETRVTYATVRDYFGHEREMRENNSAFADRFRLVAQAHRDGISGLVEVALRMYPAN
jgi:hypothetical protein